MVESHRHVAESERARESDRSLFLAAICVEETESVRHTATAPRQVAV
jgi:hypothetical protein